MRVLFVFICLVLFISTNLRAQNILQYQIEPNDNGVTLQNVFQNLQETQKARIFYLPEWISSYTINENHIGNNLEDVLFDIFKESDISYVLMYPKVLVMVKDPYQMIQRNKILENARQENRKIEEFRLGQRSDPTSKGTVLLSGRVSDLKTGEALPFATISVDGGETGAITDPDGNYELEVPSGAHVITFSFVEYEQFVVDLKAYEDGVVNVELEKRSVLLDEVVIRSQIIEEMSVSRIGETQLLIPAIKRAPAFLGEADVIKQILNLPGVTTVGEAAAGFNVRGGSVDQNLILYDGLPVYNSSHVFGFFSSFNPESVSGVSFLRGGIPANYGGRVSSVLDIRTRDGDDQEWNGNLGIGMITSNLMVNGPIKKERTTVLAAFRTTYSDWLLKRIESNYAELNKSEVSFYDGTIKLTHQTQNNSRLSVTGYSSQDRFRLKGDTTYQWRNFQLSAKLNKEISESMDTELLAGVSRYGYGVINDQPLTASRLSYHITSTVLKADFNWHLASNQLNFGWQLTHYYLDPGRLEPESSLSNAKRLTLDRQASLENAFYITNQWNMNARLFIEAGFRLPQFISFGSEEVFQYEEGLPREVGNITDTLRFGKGEITKAYFGYEPRLSLRWMTGARSSIKLGYNRMYQFLHLVTNTTAVTPEDIWQPSGYYFKPQWADQISLGYFMDSKERKYGASAEVFYKQLHNILDFKDGAQLILNDHLETDLLQGTGRSYGLETMLRKNDGKLTGTLNYTYSRAYRKIKGQGGNESINGGLEYRANFDQPHVLNLSWKYNFTRRYALTGNFTYQTGRPVTIPLVAFAIENSTVSYFSSRNQYRIPNYHRLDLALVIEGNHKKEKHLEGTWVFSVYNVYGRNNPYSIFFQNTSFGFPRPYQLSIIGRVFPSFSYNLKFK